MRHITIISAVLSIISASIAHADTLPSEQDMKILIDKAFIAETMKWLEVPVMRLTVEARNAEAQDIDQARIDELDLIWRAETKVDDQPIITSVLSSPLSSYLTRIQANSLGLYSEIFVMDRNGLNAGQSAITTDYWQGDEAKFQKTYDVGANAIFIDDAEFNDGSATWRAQLNLTLHSESGEPIGAATVEINLTELARRRAAGIQ